MSDKTHTKPMTIALGTAFAATMTVAGAASATANPFQAEEIASPSSYTRIASSHSDEGSCGSKKDDEGSCGSKKGGEGSCGSA